MATLPQPPASASIPQLLPLAADLLPAEVVQALLTTVPHRFYDRLWTPFITLWCFVCQWLNTDHTCDGVLSFVEAGAIDDLDTRHAQPFSARVTVGSTAGYCKARQRLPLVVLEGALRHTARVIQDRLGEAGRWHGHPVALLDGTTLLLTPTAALVAASGQHANDKGPGYWVVVRAVAAFCLATGALVEATLGSLQQSEQAWAKGLLAGFPAGTLVLGDSNFGVFSVAQAARPAGVFVLLRLTASRATALAKRTRAVGTDVQIAWSPTPQDQSDPRLSTEPIVGRLLRVPLERPGFRPFTLCLFTTLLDADQYPVAELVALYGRRWDVELDLRYVKATLGMAQLTTKSPDLVHKDFLAGLLAYNLLRAVMLDAAEHRHCSPLDLRFTSCWRRLRTVLGTRHPTDAPAARTAAWSRLVDRVAQCRLRPRPRFRIEPRAVRRRRCAYPPLKGSRADARQRARLTQQAPAGTKC